MRVKCKCGTVQWVCMFPWYCSCGHVNHDPQCPVIKGTKGCIHLGDQVSLKECKGCIGIQVKVFACAVHGECTYKQCKSCKQFETAQ